MFEKAQGVCQDVLRDALCRCAVDSTSVLFVSDGQVGREAGGCTGEKGGKAERQAGAAGTEDREAAPTCSRVSRKVSCPLITGTVHLHMDVLSTLFSCPAVAWQARQCYVGCARKFFSQLAGKHCTDHTDVPTTAYVAVEQAGGIQRGREEVWSGGQQAAWRISPPPCAIASGRWSPPTFCIFW